MLIAVAIKHVITCCYYCELACSDMVLGASSVSSKELVNPSVTHKMRPARGVSFVFKDMILALALIIADLRFATMRISPKCSSLGAT